MGTTGNFCSQIPQQSSSSAVIALSLIINVTEIIQQLTPAPENCSLETERGRLERQRFLTHCFSNKIQRPQGSGYNAEAQSQKLKKCVVVITAIIIIITTTIIKNIELIIKNHSMLWIFSERKP